MTRPRVMPASSHRMARRKNQFEMFVIATSPLQYRSGRSLRELSGCHNPAPRPSMQMDTADPTETFHRLRPRLFGIAYRMLGTRADAEDVLQDAWLRWEAADRALLQSDEAWLVT